MEESERQNALCGGALAAAPAEDPGGEALRRAVGAMAQAMAALLEPDEAAVLRSAAAILAEGGDDGDA